MGTTSKGSAMPSNLQQAVQVAAERLHEAAVKDGRSLDTTPMESRDSLNNPAFKDPYADGANMLYNAAYLISEREKVIVDLAIDLLAHGDMLEDSRIRELQSMIEVYS